MEHLIQALSLILISSVKFVVGPVYVYINENYNFTFFETNLYSITGGMLGVVVFIYFSDWLLKAWKNIKKFLKRLYGKRVDFFSPPVADTNSDIEIKYSYIEEAPRKKKIFTPLTRKFVRIWRRYGLIGVAALTPVLVSIPVGTFIMTRLEPNKKKILLYMFISITCWSLLLTSIFELFHFHNIPEIVK